MRKKTISIPVKHFDDGYNPGITIEKMVLNNLSNLKKAAVNDYKEVGQTHRHDRHSFFLLENGTVSIEIDFKKHKINAPAVIYMHPSQVHRILGFKNVIVHSLAISNESLNPEYLKLLEEITPAKPLALKKEHYYIISEAASLCIKLSARNREKLYHSILRDGCNAVVALVASQYIERGRPTDNLPRFEMVTRAFKADLERTFSKLRRPSEYAQGLNISTAYLNECVKNTTGYSVSHHIQQRIILEAKRLLYHSGKSVKEIATELGYDDYPYFSRLFTKVTGMTALTFRSKNPD